MGSLGDNEFGSESSGGSPSLSQFNSSVSSWHVEDDSMPGGMAKGLDDSAYFEPLSPRRNFRNSRGSKMSRKCSTPTNITPRSNKRGVDGEMGGKDSMNGSFSHPERPKSAMNLSPATQKEEPEVEAPNMENWEVIGVEILLPIEDKTTGQVKPAYYWLPYKQEYKMSNLRKDTKPDNRVLFQQLCDKLHYEEQAEACYVRATLDGKGNFDYILDRKDIETAKGSNTFLVDIYPLK